MAQMNSDGSDNGINLAAHETGNPVPQINIAGGVTVTHTVLWVIGILVVLWLLGYGFRSVRL